MDAITEFCTQETDAEVQLDKFVITGPSKVTHIKFRQFIGKMIYLYT